MICFSLALRGKPHVTMEVDNTGQAEVDVSITPNEIIPLMYDCLSDWDMLTESQIQQIIDLRDELNKCFKLHTGELRCANCNSPYACENCRNFSGQ